MKALIDKLHQNQILDAEELAFLLDNHTAGTNGTSATNSTYMSGTNYTNEINSVNQYLFEKSRSVAIKYYGNKIYVRGLIEFTNYCKNDCYYCGIRRSNKNIERYHLSFDDILSCCDTGYSLGFRTFVLQGGEDLSYSDDEICRIIHAIKSKYPDCAVTLSIGERNYESYLEYYKAGADRYLLRHETANPFHYRLLHPENQVLSSRKQCLYNLKKIGYQVGTGFMVGSPHQTIKDIVEDLLFIKELKPHMIGIGPFIPHKDTPFFDKPPGTLDMTLFLIGILRLMMPNVLIPSTTALGTIHPQGREKGILAGANVVMPNLSPVNVRNKYTLYDNKICTGEEAAECKFCLQKRIESIGYKIVVDRGDFKPIAQVR
ncbi:MAG: [FeFe] hydrogenase H-cluster radical SAM maturase HydE [Clostridiaceae bacterium]|jgi:biotin synthase|nr:[FeFe] hydrogenase H-cluster radical SAM maturase HydE [Clostridiaceae bacterium]